MSTKQSGIQLVPPPPATLISSSNSNREWADILSYRNRLVDTRNAQLEHQQTAAHLYDKVRQACRDLSRKDSNVKEGMEVLNLERQRLGYLRDELARRADMLTRWESRVRDAELKATGVSRPRSTGSADSTQRELDRMNALLLEVEYQKKMVPDSQVRSEESVIVATPGTRKSTQGFLHQEQLPSVAISKKSPVSVAVGVEADNPLLEYAQQPLQPGAFENVPSPGDAIVVTADDTTPAAAPPRPYPIWTEEGPTEDAFVDEMRETLDYIWKEYSTEIGSENDRLMTMPNLMRLCADANLGAPTQAVIEIYLRATKLGSQCLVERKFFLTVLQSVLSLTLGRETDPVKLTDLLFSEYMMPLMVRLTVQHKLSLKHHPSLPPTSIARAMEYNN